MTIYSERLSDLDIPEEPYITPTVMVDREELRARCANVAQSQTAQQMWNSVYQNMQANAAQQIAGHLATMQSTSQQLQSPVQSGLKVGDKVRCINQHLGIPIGTRGSIEDVQTVGIHVEWEGGGGNWVSVNTAHIYFIKEFQPGDRVVRNDTPPSKPNGTPVPTGTVGTVTNVDAHCDFEVKWDGRNTGWYSYNDNKVSYAVTDSVPPPAPPAIRTAPTIPPPPPVRKPCYACGLPGEASAEDMPGYCKLHGKR